MADRQDGPLEKIQAAIGWCALTLVLLSAIPLGSNRPVSWLGLSAAALILFSCQLLVDIGPSRGSQKIVKLWGAAILMLAVLIWGFIQTSVGATAALTGWSNILASMAGWNDTVSLTHPTWAAVDMEGTISADPISGRNSLFRMFAYIALFWIAVRAGNKAARAATMMKAIGVFVAVLSAFGLFAYASGQNPILGDEVSGTLSATFVNRNSFATYAAFGVLVNLAILLEIQHGLASESAERALRRFLETFFAGGWLFTIAFFICATALVASQSRGGALSLVVGMAVLLAANHANRSEGGGPALVVVALGVVFVVSTSATGLLGRIISAPDEESRFPIYGRILEAISLRPWIGHGLGSFEDAFRPFVPLSAAAAEWDKAHNTYLELAFELGIPMAALFFLAIFLVALRVFRGALTRQRFVAIPLAGIGCIVAAAVHSVFDFSLQIPAIAAVFAFIVGLAWVQSFPERQRS